MTLLLLLVLCPWIRLILHHIPIIIQLTKPTFSHIRYIAHSIDILAMRRLQFTLLNGLYILRRTFDTIHPVKHALWSSPEIPSNIRHKVIETALVHVVHIHSILLTLGRIVLPHVVKHTDNGAEVDG